MVEVVALDEFVGGYDELDEADAEAVTRSVDTLEIKGVSLGFPQSSDIEGASFPLRELRVQSGGKPLRVFYAFDPARQGRAHPRWRQDGRQAVLRDDGGEVRRAAGRVPRDG